MKKKFFKNHNKQILANINKHFINSYNFIEYPISYRNKIKDRKHVYLYPDIRIMNNIMRTYYKAPKLQLTVKDNLIPFKFTTDDGVVLSGLQYISSLDSEKWIVVDHWLGSHKLWGLYWSRPFMELGYNILTFDHRNHKDSSSTDFISLGMEEYKDLLGAAKWLSENKKYKSVGILGIGLGAYDLNLLAIKYNETLVKYKVKFAISDSFYGSIKTLLHHSNRVKLGSINKKKEAKERMVEKIIAKSIKKSGLDWNELDVFAAFENQNQMKLDIPILFMHGKDDKVAPVSDTLHLSFLRSKYIANDEVHIFDFSSHCMSLKENYDETIYQWLQFENKFSNNNELTLNAMKYFEIDNNLIEKWEGNNGKTK